MSERLPTQEQTPNPYEAAMGSVGLNEEERTLCRKCTPENKDALIGWYVRQQELARQSPDSRAGIELDIKAGVMQYVIAHDMQQRTEAFERLSEARSSALADGMPELAAKADRVMDVLDAV